MMMNEVVLVDLIGFHRVGQVGRIFRHVPIGSKRIRNTSIGPSGPLRL